MVYGQKSIIGSSEFIRKYNLQRKSLRECARVPRFWEEFVMDRIGDARNLK